MTQTAHNHPNVPQVESRASSRALPRCSNVTEGKHYFEGMNRICSKLGGGFDAGLLGEIEDTVPALACNYVQQSKRQNEGVNRTFADCLGMGAEVDGKYDLYKVVIRETERDEKEPAFYYHSDHLGSAAYLTNDDGKVTQTLNYLPYGEDWVDVRYDLDPRIGQYTFNGKEKDHESGFHYYGARYYWSELLTGWLSVDPMIDKYPNISSYAYCAWNPIKAIDPNGMDSVHTPNGIANVGDGYRATPDGQYLYGEGLQTKRWNPYLEVGGVVGERGGYENCGDGELHVDGIILAAAGNVEKLNDVVGVGSDGCLSYKRTKHGKLAHGTARNRIKPIGKSFLGKVLHRGGNGVAVVISANEVYYNFQAHGINSPETYSSIGGLAGTMGAILASTAAGASMGVPVGGIGAIPGAIIGFSVGVVSSIIMDNAGRSAGEWIYEKTH